MADHFSMKIEGVSELQEKLRQFGGIVAQSVGKGMYREGEAIMAKSKPITPIEFGPLRASGHVELPVITQDGASVELGYGGPSAPYAVYVHERTDLHHRPPTQAKFLEQPLKEAAEGMGERLAEFVSLDLHGRV